MHLKQNHLSLFEAAYAGCLDLVPCRIDMKVVCSVDVSFQCRCGKADHTSILQASGIEGVTDGAARAIRLWDDGWCVSDASYPTDDVRVHDELADFWRRFTIAILVYLAAVCSC